MRRARLSHYKDCWFDLTCCTERRVYMPINLLMPKYGDSWISDVAARFRCKDCHNTPKSIWLRQNPCRMGSAGYDPGWSFEIL